MCPSHRKQSPQGRLSICNALPGDRAYKTQYPYDHRTRLIDQRSLASAGLCVLALTRQAMVGLSDRASRFHPWHVVLRPTQADEFEMPVRCDWISHRPPSRPACRVFFCRWRWWAFVAGAHGGFAKCRRSLRKSASRAHSRHFVAWPCAEKLLTLWRKYSAGL